MYNSYATLLCVKRSLLCHKTVSCSSPFFRGSRAPPYARLTLYGKWLFWTSALNEFAPLAARVGGLQILFRAAQTGFVYCHTWPTYPSFIVLFNLSLYLAYWNRKSIFSSTVTTEKKCKHKRPINTQYIKPQSIEYTAVCIMIDRLQKWVKCNFPSPLIGIHGHLHWRLGVSDSRDSKALVRLGFLNVGIIQYYALSPCYITDYSITLWKQSTVN